MANGSPWPGLRLKTATDACEPVVDAHSVALATARLQDDRLDAARASPDQEACVKPLLANESKNSRPLLGQPPPQRHRCPWDTSRQVSEERNGIHLHSMLCPRTAPALFLLGEITNLLSQNPIKQNGGTPVKG